MPASSVHSSHVIVGGDGSEPLLQALRWGLDYAGLVGGRVTAVTSWQFPAMPYGTELIAPPPYDAENVAHGILSQAVNSVRRDEDVAVAEVLVEGPAASALIDKSRGADLLVVGNRGHGGFAGLLLGSVSAQCVHHAQCPVLVIRKPS